MSESQSVPRFLAQAKEKEKYDWFGAIDFHQKALDNALEKAKILKPSEIEERIGYCFHRAALQGESVNEFSQKNRTNESRITLNKEIVKFDKRTLKQQLLIG